MVQDDEKLEKGRFLAGPDRCLVHILLGSKSDVAVANRAVKVLEELEVPYALTIASAHRTPDIVESTVKGSSAKVFIAIAGLSAALPGVVASHTQSPVIGVPVSGKLDIDAILSIVQMPPGVPVGAVGLDRGDNAALLAARVLAIGDGALLRRLGSYSARMREKVVRSSEEVLGG